MSEKYLTDENGLLLLWADGEPITLHDDELEDDGGQQPSFFMAAQNCSLLLGGRKIGVTSFCTPLHKVHNDAHRKHKCFLKVRAGALKNIYVGGK